MSDFSDFKVTVIIPFYQKEKGILSRALHSVYTQTDWHFIHEIIVVDDGSPCAAEDEISEIYKSYEYIIPIVLIKQDNSGVSAARNKGIHSANESSTHIAFLDSDDRWHDDHIKYAVRAFNLGAKFYFSNFYQLNSDLPAFSKSSKFDISTCDMLEEYIYQYNNCFINQVVVSNPVGTPTVVYDKRDAKDIYFDQKYKYAGEDYMMWVALSRKLGKVYFCVKPTVTCDAGVNIFSGAKWGSLHLTYRLLDEIAYKKAMLSIPELHVQSRISTLNTIKRLKRSLVKNSLSRAARFKFSGIFRVIYALSL